MPTRPARDVLVATDEGKATNQTRELANAGMIARLVVALLVLCALLALAEVLLASRATGIEVGGQLNEVGREFRENG